MLCTCTPSALSIHLAAEEAKAVVNAIRTAVIGEGESLGDEPVEAATMGAMRDVSGHCERITRLAAVAEQLTWSLEWVRTAPPAVGAPEEVWLDVVGELHRLAEESRRHPDEPGERYESDRAARTIARSFADAARVAS